MSVPLGIGDVVTVRFPENTPRGNEQEGYRPAVVVGLPSSALGKLRFPMLLVVPLTSDKPHYTWARANPSAYPVYPKGTARLTSDSIALIDQLRTVDASRINGRLGTLTPEELEPIKQGLISLMGPITKP